MGEQYLHAIFVSDSRGRDFEQFPEIDGYGYINHLIIKRGASIKKLENELILLLDSFPRCDYSVIYIAAGICEITEKIFHAGGQELCLRKSNTLVQNLCHAKRQLN
jgi:hypothetical protein